jgi:hypothetical protein
VLRSSESPFFPGGDSCFKTLPGSSKEQVSRECPRPSASHTHGVGGRR